ncbi:hypothetical protein TIFTF001_048450 [Ficus carica]|uniref:Uncharacterized protein n=1 Tax=Ficus carica TaxID=3494 RepID=A0AA88CUI5_FICCA|nr:hypothetical protein TIFTF001_048450 [Ficus carica]
MWSAMRKALEAKYLLTKASAYLILIMSSCLHHLDDIIKQNSLLSKPQTTGLACVGAKNWLAQQAFLEHTLVIMLSCHV